jgi:tripartite-type tricarboxylate transporter receptor subunit TctC
VTNQAMFPNLTWDPIRDFVAIGMVSTSPHVVVVPGKSPIASIADLVKTARAAPGKLSYASAGVGTTFHLCAELFKDQTKTFILHVPYRGGGPALLDTLASQVDLSFPTLAAAVPHVKQGQLRALAVTSVERSPLLPEVPTLREAGLQDFQFTQWQAVLAPAKTPPAIVARLNAALNESLRSKDVIEKFQGQAFDPLVTSPEEAGRFIAQEAQRLTRVIKSKGITAN